METEWVVVLVLGGGGALAFLLGAIIKAMRGDPDGFFGAGTVFLIMGFFAFVVAGGITDNRERCEDLASQLEAEIIGSTAWRCEMRLPNGQVISLDA